MQLSDSHNLSGFSRSKVTIRSLSAETECTAEEVISQLIEAYSTVTKVEIELCDHGVFSVSDNGVGIDFDREDHNFISSRQKSYLESICTSLSWPRDPGSSIGPRISYEFGGSFSREPNVASGCLAMLNCISNRFEIISIRGNRKCELRYEYDRNQKAQRLVQHKLSECIDPNAKGTKLKCWLDEDLCPEHNIVIDSVRLARLLKPIIDIQDNMTLFICDKQKSINRSGVIVGEAEVFTYHSNDA